MSYIVGSLKSPGHPFSTFVVAEIISEDERSFVVSRMLKVVENPSPAQDPNGPMRLGMMFLNDEFFGSDSPATIQKDAFMISKILDPIMDQKMISHIESHHTRTRMARSGIVSAAPTAVPSFPGAGALK